jgi:DNA-binding transcriptional MerR regulator
MSEPGAQFDDGKDTGALRPIGEVSAALGIKPHVLRYWEDQFPSLKPLKRAGGRRLYLPEDVALVKRIQSLITREGYTLKGAKAALAGAEVSRQDRPARPAGAAAQAGDLLPRLKAIRDDLAAALTA